MTTNGHSHRDSNKIPRAPSSVHTRMSSKWPFQKMAETSKEDLLLGGGIRHVTGRRCITCTVNNFLLA